MRYVILRDDDTNALTPIECLERLYRPFLERGLPVNLAVIPDVAVDATTPEGTPEGFLFARNGTQSRTVPFGNNSALVAYLRDNPGYHVVQHGCHHDRFEFERPSTREIAARLDRGAQLLAEVGFPKPETFVAPHDKFSRAAYREVRSRFRVISSGWFERRRLPMTWWPRYVAKKIRRAPHWRVGDTTLLSHPGCLLSWRHPYATMLEDVTRDIQRRRLTVIVTHWWEYFRDGQPDEEFIRQLHQVADYLAGEDEIRVVSFSDVAEGQVPLN